MHVCIKIFQASLGEYYRGIKVRVLFLKKKLCVPSAISIVVTVRVQYTVSLAFCFGACVCMKGLRDGRGRSSHLYIRT